MGVIGSRENSGNTKVTRSLAYKVKRHPLYGNSIRKAVYAPRLSEMNCSHALPEPDPLETNAGTVQELLGQKDVSTAMMYTHVLKKRA